MIKGRRLCILCLAAFAAFGVQPALASQDDAMSPTDARAGGAPRLLIETKRGRLPVDVASMPLLRNRIHLNFSGTPVRDALAQVEGQGAIRLMYADDLVKPGAVVDLRADGITVAAALIDILDGTGLDVIVPAPGIASLVRRPAPPPVGNISGTVKDSLGQPVIAATLRVEGTQLGAVTDAEGRYRISGIRPGSQTITVRRIGYQLATKAVTVQDGASETVDFVLAASITSLKAQVVTGTTGAVERIARAAVVASVDASDVQRASPPSSDPVQMLAGTVAGASVSSTGSQTGDAMHMFIRGPSSVFLNNEPLVFVDGVRVNSTPRALLSLGGQQGNPLENLNPDDIRVDGDRQRGGSVDAVRGGRVGRRHQHPDETRRHRKDRLRPFNAGRVAKRRRAIHRPATNYAKCSAAAVLSTSSVGPVSRGQSAGSIISDSPLLRTGAFRIGDGGKIDYSLRGGGADFGYFASASVSNEQGVEVPNGLHGYTARGNFYWTATPKLTFNLGMNLADNDNFLSNGDQGTAISIGGFGGNPLTVFRTGSGALDGGWYQSPGVELDRYNSLLQEYPHAQVDAGHRGELQAVELVQQPAAPRGGRFAGHREFLQSDRSRADGNGENRWIGCNQIFSKRPTCTHARL